MVQSETILLTPISASFLISMLPPVAIISHLGSITLVKVFLYVDGCQFSASVKGQKKPPILPSY